VFPRAFLMARRGPKRKERRREVWPRSHLAEFALQAKIIAEDDAENVAPTCRRASLISETDTDLTHYLSREQVILRQSQGSLNVHGVPW